MHELRNTTILPDIPMIKNKPVIRRFHIWLRTNKPEDIGKNFVTPKLSILLVKMELMKIEIIGQQAFIETDVVLFAMIVNTGKLFARIIDNTRTEKIGRESSIQF